jgi:hypothetical protein
MSIENPFSSQPCPQEVPGKEVLEVNNPLTGTPEDGANQESREGGEAVKENDLIVPDSQVELVKSVLENNGIPCKSREYIKRDVNNKTGGYTGGEFVVSILDPEDLGKPASFDFVKQVFELVRDSNLVVRYGKNPERG